MSSEQNERQSNRETGPDELKPRTPGTYKNKNNKKGKRDRKEVREIHFRSYWGE